MMGSFFLVPLLFPLLLMSVISLTPLKCVGEDCATVNGTVRVYLGPKWGYKTIQLHNVSTVRDLSVADDAGRPGSDNSTASGSNEEYQDFKITQWVKFPILENNPVPVDDSLPLNLSGPSYSGKDYPDSSWKPPLRLNTTTIRPRRVFFNSTTTRRPSGSYSRNSTYAKDRYVQSNNLSEGWTTTLGPNLTVSEVKELLDATELSVKRGMKRLYLSNNKINYLLDQFFPVELEYGLLELHLDGNPLNWMYRGQSTQSSFFFELQRLGKLKTLNLSRTGLYYLDTLYMPFLENLDLSRNNLNYLPTLSGLDHLRKLDLSHNLFTTIVSFPSRYESLWSLNLANVSLENFYERSTASTLRILTLNLENNQLRNLDKIDINHCSKVYLGGNPWECKCSLMKMVQNTYPMVEDKENIRCTDDNISVAHLVTSLTKDDVKDCNAIVRRPILQLINQKLLDVASWLRDHGITWQSIFSTVWSVFMWALPLIGLIAVLRIVKSQKFQLIATILLEQHKSVPYTALDENMIEA